GTNGPGIVPIGGHMIVIGGGQGLPSFRANAGTIVAGKLARRMIGSWSKSWNAHRLLVYPTKLGETRAGGKGRGSGGEGRSATSPTAPSVAADLSLAHAGLSRN